MTLTSHTENSSPEKPRACGHDVGLGFRCRREAGHEGFHTWDPGMIGERTVPLPDEKDVE